MGEKLLIEKKKENKRLQQERDSAQKNVNDLSKKLRESQKPQKSNDDKKEQYKPMVCGGTMNKEIDDNIRSIAAKIKDAVINKAKSDDKNCKFEEFTPIQAKSQVVAGINWFLKIRTAKNAFIHIRVWAKLNKEYEISAIQYNKAEDDPLGYF